MRLIAKILVLKALAMYNHFNIEDPPSQLHLWAIHIDCVYEISLVILYIERGEMVLNLKLNSTHRSTIR